MITPKISITIEVSLIGTDLKVKSNCKMEMAELQMISLALANLEITKLQLINEYMKLNKIEKKNE